MGKEPTRKTSGGVMTTDTHPVRRAQRSPEGRVRLSEVQGVLGALQAALDNGDAIILGSTSDGGAYSITILQGDQRHRTYVHDAAELHDAMQAILQMYV
jgi:hypothetical protein